MIKLHLGCGKRDFGEKWIHIDGGNFSHLKEHNITSLSQFEDNSVDIIYSSHVLEYFDREEALDVLKEWNRVLKKGGTLRIAVPDFESMTSLYYRGECLLSDIIGPLYGKMGMSNDTIYHKTVYDFSSIVEMLNNAGFDTVEKYNWRDTEHSHIDDCSVAYLPKMDFEKGTLISLNVEATK